MQPGAHALAAAAEAAGTESQVQAAFVARFAMTASLVPGTQLGFSSGSPMLASASDHISMSVSYLNPLVNASLTSIKLTVN